MDEHLLLKPGENYGHLESSQARDPDSLFCEPVCVKAFVTLLL
jgi:hypothetical protein